MATSWVIAGSLASSALPSAAWRRTLARVASTVAPLTVSSRTEISPTSAPGRVTLLTTTPHLVTFSAPDTRIRARRPSRLPGSRSRPGQKRPREAKLRERACRTSLHRTRERAGATAAECDASPARIALLGAIDRALAAGEHRRHQVLAPAPAFMATIPDRWTATAISNASASHAWTSRMPSSPQNASRRLIHPVTPKSSTSDHSSQTIQRPSGSCPGVRGVPRRRYEKVPRREGFSVARPAVPPARIAHSQRAKITPTAA